MKKIKSEPGTPSSTAECQMSLSASVVSPASKSCRSFSTEKACSPAKESRKSESSETQCEHLSKSISESTEGASIQKQLMLQTQYSPDSSCAQNSSGVVSRIHTKTEHCHSVSSLLAMTSKDDSPTKIQIAHLEDSPSQAGHLVEPPSSQRDNKILPIVMPSPSSTEAGLEIVPQMATSYCNNSKFTSVASPPCNMSVPPSVPQDTLLSDSLHSNRIMACQTVLERSTEQKSTVDACCQTGVIESKNQGIMHPLLKRLFEIDLPTRLTNHQPEQNETELSLMAAIVGLADTELTDIVTWAKSIPGMYIIINM